MGAIVRNALAAVVLLASSSMFGGQASATIIYESATLGTTGSSVGGYDFLGSTQFFGSRFSLSTPTAVTSIAGHIRGSGTLFGAIVSLSSSTALPTGSPFTDSEVLAWGIFTASSPSSEQTLALSVTLGIGDYGVIFGSGQFGATGDGGMPSGDLGSGSTNIGSPTYFFWISPWMNDGFGQVRFVVNGDAAVVPEPTTFLLWGTTAAGLGLVGWRRRRGRAHRPPA